MGKNLLANAGDIRDTGLIPGLGRFPGGGHDNLLHYSCLGNPMDRVAWWAAESNMTACRHTCRWVYYGKPCEKFITYKEFFW